MKSLHRQRHSRMATAAAPTQQQHQLQLSPRETDATGRQLFSGSCSCGEMTPTPSWGTDEIHHAHTLHTQMHTALLELRRINGHAEQYRKENNR
ncbi:hypothetical protein IU459_32780 [Nocardia amamiensis]|uniref:Uncharacterized protein n=1 Tax=Nocardia amamiensis TaxID=404578 RepID=A0ABS0D0B6_9NOCA|nr:hypothetical protein [Nocardia amamiensis]MBF6302281.1 hypothetical protein [Nocardia amamiensis]